MQEGRCRPNDGAGAPSEAAAGEILLISLLISHASSTLPYMHQS